MRKFWLWMFELVISHKINTDGRVNGLLLTYLCSYLFIYWLSYSHLLVYIRQTYSQIYIRNHLGLLVYIHTFIYSHTTHSHIDSHTDMYFYCHPSVSHFDIKKINRLWWFNVCVCVCILQVSLKYVIKVYRDYFIGFFQLRFVCQQNTKQWGKI